MANTKISALTSATTPLAGTEVVPLVQSSTTKKVSVANLTAGRTVDVSILLANSTSVDANWKVQANASSSGVTGVGVNNNGGYGFYLTYDNSGRYSGGGGGLRNIANTPIYVETNNTIIGKFDTSGNYIPVLANKGVNFTANTGAAGMTSQLLNWYEEGTFTPTVYGGTTAGVTTYASQVGYYTRIGRMVYYRIYVDWTNQTGTGTLYIGGLPYTSLSAGSATPGTVYANNLTFTANSCLSCAVVDNTTTLILVQTVNNTNAAVVAIDTSASLVMSGMYFTS